MPRNLGNIMSDCIFALFPGKDISRGGSTAASAQVRPRLTFKTLLSKHQVVFANLAPKPSKMYSNFQISLVPDNFRKCRWSRYEDTPQDGWSKVSEQTFSEPRDGW